MHRWASLACASVLILFGMGAVHATTQVELLDTWPADSAVTLARNQNLYLHLRYTSDAPVRIWARPYFQGELAKAGSNPSRVYPAGSGEALGWFFLSPGAQVDEVQIRAGDGSPRGTQVVATWPVSVTSSDEPAPASSPPAWVTSLSAADKAAQDAAYQKAMDTPPGIGETIAFGGFMLAMVVLLVLGIGWPIWGLARWQGGWRLAVATPLVVMVFVVLRILVGTALDPTSYNLWPFEIVMWGGASCVWMLVAALIRKLSGGSRPS